MHDDHPAVLLERIESQNQAVLEAVGDIQKQISALPRMQEDIAELKSDMKVVKAAVTNLSGQVSDHEARITQLEAA